MSVDNDLAQILKEIESGEFNENKSLPHLDRNRLKKCVLMAEEEGYISHRSSKGKLLEHFMDGAWSISHSVFLTRKGCQFLEGIDRDSPQTSSYNFNVGTAYNSAIGVESTVTNNYSNTPILDLKKFVSELDSEDQLLGNDLINTLEKGEPKRGFLQKFEKLITKYPKVTDLIASALISMAFGGLSK